MGNARIADTLYFFCIPIISNGKETFVQSLPRKTQSGIMEVVKSYIARGFSTDGCWVKIDTLGKVEIINL